MEKPGVYQAREDDVVHHRDDLHDDLDLRNRNGRLLGLHPDPFGFLIPTEPIRDWNSATSVRSIRSVRLLCDKVAIRQPCCDSDNALHAKRVR